MTIECAMLVTFIFTVALVSGFTLYCDIKSKEFDEDEDE